MNNNYKSKKIVKSWFEKVETSSDSYNDFDRFISLWVSFNCFFVAELYNDAKKLANNRDPSEKNYLEAFYTTDEFKKIYINLINESISFKENLRKWKHLLERITFFKGKIADLRPNHLEEKYAKEFNDINNFKQLIMSAYQLRCNLFHGNKHPEDDSDVQLVSTMFKILLEFLKKLYLDRGYLND